MEALFRWFSSHMFFRRPVSINPEVFVDVQGNDSPSDVPQVLSNFGKNLIRLHCSPASDLLLQKMPLHRLTKVTCFLSNWIYLIRSLGHAFAIQVMSDLHLEYSFHRPGNSTVVGYEAFDFKPCAPVLALLGDVGLVSQNGLFVFLRRQLLKYEKILYVMGNHEFYDSYFVCQFFSCSLSC